MVPRLFPVRRVFGVRRFGVRTALVLCGISCGCVSDGTNSPMSDAWQQTVRIFAPRPDNDAANKTGDDEWNEVGKQARADRPVEQENDPLRNLFVSPRAQEIERSLGVD